MSSSSEFICDRTIQVSSSTRENARVSLGLRRLEYTLCVEFSELSKGIYAMSFLL